MYAGLSFIDPSSAVRCGAVATTAALSADKTEFELLKQRLTTCGQSNKEVPHVNESCHACE